MKELIIIVYKINVDGQTRQQADQAMKNIYTAYNLKNDKELKDNYIIREIYLPIIDSPTDVKVIYPIPRYTTSPEINDLVNEISNKIKNDPTNDLTNSWIKLVRELKLRKLETC